MIASMEKLHRNAYTFSVGIDAKAVANYFLSLGVRDGKPLTPMKLQALVYYAYGWYLAIKGEPLFDEPVEARQYGPVIAPLFQSVLEFGNKPIPQQIEEIEFDAAKGITKRWFPWIEDSNDKDKEIRKILDKIWDTYSGYSQIQLSNLTHEQGSPWAVVATGSGGIPKDVVIPNALIKQYFTALAKEG